MRKKVYGLKKFKQTPNFSGGYRMTPSFQTKLSGATVLSFCCSVISAAAAASADN